MSSSSTPSATTAEAMLAGPRGRRLLIEYALATEITHNPVRTEQTFGYAAVRAAIRLATDQIGKLTPSRKFFKDRLISAASTGATERLSNLTTTEPTSRLLRAALAATTGNARYWEAPDGLDLLAASPPMRGPLRDIAEHLIASPLTAWWHTPAPIQMQYAVQWEFTAPQTAHDDAPPNLLAAANHDAQHNVRENPPIFKAADWSGEWSSRPPQAASTRLLWDDSPAGLWFVEDSLGWERARSRRLITPESATVLEIASIADWSELCKRFPLDVTAQKRDDWYRATTRTGSWMIPDWTQVAEHYDGVHLQVGAYLAAAGCPILVDEDDDTASMIAGWNPDEVYWFSTDLSWDRHYTDWNLEDDGVDMMWRRR